MRMRPPERRRRRCRGRGPRRARRDLSPSSRLKSSRLPTPPLRSSKRSTRWRLRHPSGSGQGRGDLLGQSAAATIVTLRSGDGANAPFLDFAYVPGPNPGDFQLIPGLPFAAAPGWGDVTPFVLRSSSQYRPKRPYDLQSKKYAADFNEVKSLGAVNSATRTD